MKECQLCLYRHVVALKNIVEGNEKIYVYLFKCLSISEYSTKSVLKFSVKLGVRVAARREIKFS